MKINVKYVDEKCTFALRLSFFENEWSLSNMHVTKVLMMIKIWSVWIIHSATNLASYIYLLIKRGWTNNFQCSCSWDEDALIWHQVDK